MRIILLAASLSLALPITAQTTSVAAPAPQPAPYSQNPILQLQGNARALLVFAPDTTTPALQTQFAVLERDEMELAKRDTILVPIITTHHGPDDTYPGENINPGSSGDQLSARQKFGITKDEFAIVLLSKDGTELFRSTTPVNVSSLNAQIDGIRGSAN